MPNIAASKWPRRVKLLCIAGILISFALIYSRYDIPEHRKLYTKVFFSADDGASFYADDLRQIPPITQDGKTVVRAHIFSYDAGSHVFVGYLGRYTPEWKHMIDSALAEARKKYGEDAIPDIVRDTRQRDGTEVKLPGPGHAWVPLLSKDGQKIINVTSSAGVLATQMYP